VVVNPPLAAAVVTADIRRPHAGIILLTPIPSCVRRGSADGGGRPPGSHLAQRW
jgi:hypothetical protein